MDVQTSNWPLLREAVGTTSAQLVGLLRSVRDPHARAVGAWSIRDLAVHLADVYTNYPRYLQGEGPLFAATGEITAHNAAVVRAGSDMGLEEAAERIASSSRDLTEILADREAHERVRWHAGIELKMTTFAAIPLSEAMIHGHDIAAAERRSFRPDPPHASAALVNLTELLPHYLNEAGAAGFTAVYDLRLRGGDRRFLAFDNGSLAVTAEPQSADCIISADAHTFMLIGYNRISQWRAALTGKIMTWGRKPWLALKLPHLIASP